MAETCKRNRLDDVDEERISRCAGIQEWEEVKVAPWGVRRQEEGCCDVEECLAQCRVRAVQAESLSEPPVPASWVDIDDSRRTISVGLNVYRCPACVEVVPAAITGLIRVGICISVLW